MLSAGEVLASLGCHGPRATADDDKVPRIALINSLRDVHRQRLRGTIWQE